MAMKTTLTSCLVISLFVFQETTASLKTCDAAVDITLMLDSSASLSYMNYKHQIEFSEDLMHYLFLWRNDVRLRNMFYNTHAFQYYSNYHSYEDRGSLPGSTSFPQSNDTGDDVILGLTIASKLEPETACRRKRGARRLVVAVADVVDRATYTPHTHSVDFRNVMEQRGVDVLVLAVGNDSTLDSLSTYLDLNGRDRIIKVDNFTQLYDRSVLDEVLEEVCRVTPEMARYREGLSSSFRANYTYNGHSYYLSREYFHNFTQVYDTCSSAGGYLAIMNDQQEYDAMKQYFTDNAPGYGIFIDGTDALKEGVWTLLSGAPLPFVDWMENHPRNTSGRNCLIWTWRHQGMFDEFCYGHPYYPYLFLCEVANTCDA